MTKIFVERHKHGATVTAVNERTGKVGKSTKVSGLGGLAKRTERDVAIAASRAIKKANK